MFYRIAQQLTEQLDTVTIAAENKKAEQHQILITKIENV